MVGHGYTQNPGKRKAKATGILAHRLDDLKLRTYRLTDVTDHHTTPVDNFTYVNVKCQDLATHININLRTTPATYDCESPRAIVTYTMQNTLPKI